MPSPTPVTAKPAANTDAVVTIAPVSGRVNQLVSINWNFDKTPSGATLTIESPGGTTRQTLNISKAGGGTLKFPQNYFNGQSGQEIVVTLTAGGSGVLGTLSVLPAE